MSITVEEKYGRVLSDNSAELTYIVRGTDDDTAARTQLLAVAAQTHNDIPLDDVEVEEIAPPPTSIWLGTVKYKSGGGGQNEQEPSYSFETRGGTQHITQSRNTIASYATSGQTAPNFGGAIGVTRDGVEGVDITVPVFSFSETHSFLGVSQAYKNTLFNLTGTVNNAGFKGLAAGECLFIGAAGAKRGTDWWQVTFAFAGSPNMANLSVGDITGIAKKGWQYLWVRYQESEDVSAKMLIHKPIAAYVEQVYPQGDFSQLGI